MVELVCTRLAKVHKKLYLCASVSVNALQTKFGIQLSYMVNIPKYHQTLIEITRYSSSFLSDTVS